MKRLTFVVTCKGRLHQLLQSLPRLAAQTSADCVLVDYDCPQHCGEWAHQHYPQVTVVRHVDAPTFNVCHARNLGAGAARTDWLCFIDADILVDENFATQVLPLLQAGHFYRPAPLTTDLWGTHLCQREDFLRVGGYDEIIQGWGGEDNDLYFRLSRLGLQQDHFQVALWQSLQHDDDARTRYYAVRDKWLSQRINTLYINLKSDIARQIGAAELAPAMRQTLYAEVSRSVTNDIEQGRPDSRFEVSLQDAAGPAGHGWQVGRTLLYQMSPTHAEVAGAAVPATAPSLTAAFFSAAAAHPTDALPTKLHIGCGNHPLPGWLNTDLAPVHPRIMPLDARQPLPFADSSFDFVFSEHLIEHIPFPAGCALLRECHRVLRPGGRIRIATPDLAFLVGLYKKGKSIMQQRYLDWSKEKFLPWAPNADDTYVINNAVRDWGHQFIYDEKVLQRALIEAGFTRLQRFPLMKSATPELAGLENEQRAPPGLVALETMVLEAYRG